ncbi:MAG: hypothetical protein GWN01_00460 [Nitrosopumilaceae archaeon]|nr:hypothetical protein [Nitrosopumilaceae archaeon]NIT99453.1 hypothetical protein [Nitrosopumilaceae archaeon]NIU85812.1 hypothetical protein [Nitrosopumilaceae archaeon]NIV64669.1 hypothetical protein [Nitrosopumilaceae archaeon]NIX60056.1 hypothetical protein [Nitrosopumilaceae archaeon]
MIKLENQIKNTKNSEDDDSLLKLEVQNLKELLRLKDLNNELLEIHYSLLERLVKLYKKEGRIIEPEIEALLERTRHIFERYSRTYHQPTGNRSNYLPKRQQNP